MEYIAKLFLNWKPMNCELNRFIVDPKPLLLVIPNIVFVYQSDAGWEEYYDYIFPEDAANQPNLKLLAMAKMWKKQQQQDDDENEQEEEDEEEEQQVPQGKEAPEDSEPEEQEPVASREQPENKNEDHDKSSSSDSESDGGDREDDKDKTEETKADTENPWPGVVDLSNTLCLRFFLSIGLFSFVIK